MDIERHFESPSEEVNKKEEDLNTISWYQCQCSGSSQIPSQDDLNHYHKFLSLYKLVWNGWRTELHIYNTENRAKTVKILYDPTILDTYTSFTQLPNGELFCYGNYNSGITVIINKHYRVKMLLSGINCKRSGLLYFDNNIYCFGGTCKGDKKDISRKFDFIKNRWINLTSLPKADFYCHSVVFNGNILISGYLCKNLRLYLTEIDSFSIIPYDFIENTKKLLIYVERLYLIEWKVNGLIYESKDEYNWKSVSRSQLSEGYHMYCLYNKGKVYISNSLDNYEFDLKTKAITLLTHK